MCFLLLLILFVVDVHCVFILPALVLAVEQFRCISVGNLLLQFVVILSHSLALAKQLSHGRTQKKEFDFVFGY